MVDPLHQLRSVTLGDEPDSWQALGFELDRGAGPGRLVIGATAIELTGSGEGFLGWDIDGIGAEIDGLARLRAASDAQGPVAHPNGITGIDHVVVSTGDVARSVGALEAAGIDQRGGRSTESYGSPMRQVFFWLGDVILELVGPGEDEPTRADPARLFGLALVTPDLDACVQHMGPLAGTPKDAVQPGRRIAGIRGGEVGVSIPLAVMSPHPR